MIGVKVASLVLGVGAFWGALGSVVQFTHRAFSLQGSCPGGVPAGEKARLAAWRKCRARVGEAGGLRHPEECRAGGLLCPGKCQGLAGQDVQKVCSQGWGVCIRANLGERWEWGLRVWERVWGCQ